KTDVIEIRNRLGPANNKRAIADQVKKFLDKKYTWYSWVVLVYNTAQADDYILYDLTKITEDTITVAVGYTLKADVRDEAPVRKAADDCFKDKSCEIKKKVHNCRYSWSHPYDTMGIRYSYTFTEYAKATHAVYGNDFAEAPKPFHHHDCDWTYISSRKISIYYSQKLPVCNDKTCNNHGMCRQLLDSNEWLCECSDGYYGDRCKERAPKAAAANTVVRHVSTVDTKMRKMEIKLEEVLRSINARCRG
ncbi:uncharacterized protein LOC117940419, partial [Etheostoma cragini]|uniref:uncharacterized protein LOC117940419 n=1 Tax=Etheostoma cragini TaxID=417921 RepID=UPI00155E01E5